MDIISKSLNELRGKPCWRVQWGPCPLYLDISFGYPVMSIREPYKTKSKSKSIQENASLRGVTVKGSWWLWIYFARWTIDFRGKRLADNYSSGRCKRTALAILDGQILKRVTIDAQTSATRFEFDLGGVLAVRRYRNITYHEDVLWYLFKPSGYVLSVRGDGHFAYGPGSKRDKPARRIPACTEFFSA